MTKQHNATQLLASAVLFLMVLNTIELQAATKPDGNPAAPKLIVGIAVDQLRTDYIYALEHRLSEGGFRRLMNQGVVYEQVTFDIDNPDATAALAVLATGSYPFHNGVPSGEVFNPAMLRRQSIFYDKDYIGNFTNAHLSPRALISSTLADELKIASAGTSRIFSIAPDAEQAIIGAGHSGNCALWLDEKQGKWASTTYYKEFPRYITRKNDDLPLSVNLSATGWEPMQHNDGMLDIMPFHYTTNAFNHSFYQYGQPVYDWVKTSPIINDAIVEMARLFMKSGYVGKSKYSDMLQLTFYAGVFQNDRPERFAEELEDIYLRLDKSLETLLNAIDSEVGLSNTFIYLTGTGQTTTNTTDVEETYGGTFTATRCTSLLNSYLISVYGQGQYVVDFYDYQIYLNHNFIEQQKLKLAEVQQTAAEFVMMFSGVEEVVTQQQILHGDFNERIRRMRRAYNRATGGDLLLTLQPGWTFRYNDNSTTQPQIRHDIAPGPAILFAPNLPHERITTPVDATAIAPTVAGHIRIRAPSGCTSPSLRMK